MTADAGENVEKDVGLQSGKQLWKSVFWFLRKLEILLPEDPAIPLLGMYPEDAPTSNEETCSSVFIAAIFIIARSCK